MRFTKATIHHYHHPLILGGILSVGLIVSRLVFSPGAFAQQSDSQAQQPLQAQQPEQPVQAQQSEQQPQQPDWGPAGPPPDAQNGQVPPPPPANSAPPAQQDQQQYRPADNQNGNQPPPPPQERGRAPYQPGQYQNQPNQNQPSQYQPNQPYTGQDHQGQGYQDQGYQGQYRRPAPPSGPVTIAAGTLLQIRTSEALNPKKLQPGEYFQGTAARNVYVGNVLAIPRSAQVTGRVVDVKKPGELKGSSGLVLQLTSITLGDRSYPITSDNWSSSGPGKGGYTAGNTIGTAALGTVIGAIAGGGPGAAIGAVAGTGVGLGASAATRGPGMMIPPEAVLTFHITAPTSIQPLSYEEAQRLESESAPPQRRYASRPPYPGYGYPPPPPYYYPYGYPYAYGYPYPYRYYRYWR